MTIPSISQAIKLIRSGAGQKSPYTYYFAPQMPSYAVGVTVPLSTTSGGSTSYTYNSSDFLNINSTAAESAVATALTRMDSVSGASYDYQNDFGADIVVFGLSVNLYAGTQQIGGYAYRETPG